MNKLHDTLKTTAMLLVVAIFGSAFSVAVAYGEGSLSFVGDWLGDNLGFILTLIVFLPFAATLPGLNGRYRCFYQPKK